MDKDGNIYDAKYSECDINIIVCRVWIKDFYRNICMQYPEIIEYFVVRIFKENNVIKQELIVTDKNWEQIQESTTVDRDQNITFDQAVTWSAISFLETRNKDYFLSDIKGIRIIDNYLGYYKVSDEEIYLYFGQYKGSIIETDRNGEISNNKPLKTNFAISFSEDKIGGKDARYSYIESAKYSPYTVTGIIRDYYILRYKNGNIASAVSNKNGIQLSGFSQETLSKVPLEYDLKRSYLDTDGTTMWISLGYWEEDGYTYILKVQISDIENLRKN